jgi:type II secretory pathway component PulF
VQLDINRWWAKFQFTANVRLRLYRKVAKMLSNGLPLLKILEELQARATQGGANKNDPLAIVLDDCRRMVQNGRMFSEGLSSWVPRTEQMIIMAGEQSGRLQTTLTAVIEVVQAGRQIRGVILGGIAYPIAILTLIIAYVYVFGTKVIPQFTKLVDPSKWHGAARSLYVMSGVVQAWTPHIVLALVGVVAVMLISMPRWRGNVRIFFDRFAPYSLYRLIVGSGFLTALSALQFAGVTVEKSLIRLADVSQPWLRERLEGALLGVKSGLNCGEALRNAGYGFPSQEVIDDLCIYAEYKGFADALKILAEEWMAEGVETVTIQMKALNGFAIISLAAVIGWLITGFFGIQQEIAAMTRAVH